MRERLHGQHTERMSTGEYGPFGSPAPAASAVTARRAARRQSLPGAARASLLALGNFAAFTLMLLYLVSRFQHDHDDVGTNVNFFLSSDLATPLIGWVWLLILANGLVLCMWQQTRAAGIGFVVAAAVIAVPVVTWLLWTLVTFASG
jgi:hypothetical protein